LPGKEYQVSAVGTETQATRADALVIFALFAVAHYQPTVTTTSGIGQVCAIGAKDEFVSRQCVIRRAFLTVHDYAPFFANLAGIGDPAAVRAESQQAGSDLVEFLLCFAVYKHAELAGFFAGNIK